MQLTEAMDVLHQQVDQYESEIKWLKDTKSPKPGQRRSSLSKASPFLSPGFSAEKRKSADELMQDTSPAAIGALEAALLRPALQAARHDAAACKAQSMISTLRALPPLSVSGGFHSLQVSRKVDKEESKQLEPVEESATLSTSLSDARLLARIEKASLSIVDLSKVDKSPRLALLESLSKSRSAENKLADAVYAAEQWLLDRQGTPVPVSKSDSQGSAPLVGRIKIPGDHPSVVPVIVNTPALHRLHMHMLQ